MFFELSLFLCLIVLNVFFLSFFLLTHATSLVLSRKLGSCSRSRPLKAFGLSSRTSYCTSKCWFFRLFLFWLFFLFRNKDWIMTKKVVFYALQIFQIATSYSTDRIQVIEVKQTNTEGPSNIFEYFYSVRRSGFLVWLSSCIGVKLWIFISNWYFCFMLASGLDKLWC